jgi:hypothetical protein
MFTVVIEKFENLRHLVHARLLSSEFHDLKNIVKEHVAADIWKTYCIADGNTITNITYSLLQRWHLTIEDLSVAASENEVGTQTVMKMSEVLQAYLDTPPWDDSPAMYVISNKGSYCGASAVLDPGIQQKLSEVFPNGCYILPSSIHECLAVSSEMDANILAHMVHDINRSEVREPDRLSDHVFRLENSTLSVAV